MINKERIINNVSASMRMEGMKLTKKDKERIKKCLDGEESFNKSIELLVDKHTKQR